jgi:hypothetical protein
VYEVADEGTTKMQQLTQQLKALDDGCKSLNEVFHALQSLPEELAYSILARIRAGEPITNLVAFLTTAVPSNPL